jgi:hypothetical protein
MKTYAEIIEHNKTLSSVRWWPQFAYHYTDIMNAVSIISDECLYSRVNAESLNLMRNDNASRQVLDMTGVNTTRQVRFYFRPLTPTQYYNEGYKPTSLRFEGDVNANVPVPIFFLFNLEKVLCLPDIRFSEFTQAGHGSTTNHGVEEFCKLNFAKIYSKGSMDTEGMKYRHAELLYPDRFNLEGYLVNILCRNEIEKLSLMNLLMQWSPEKFDKYKDTIKVCRSDMFYKNGFFVEDMIYYNKTISFLFAETHSRIEYYGKIRSKSNIENLEKIEAEIKLKWVNIQGQAVFALSKAVQLDYLNPRPLTLTNIPSVADAKYMVVELLVDGKIMCIKNQLLADSELL